MEKPGWKNYSAWKLVDRNIRTGCAQAHKEIVCANFTHINTQLKDMSHTACQSMNTCLCIHKGQLEIWLSGKVFKKVPPNHWGWVSNEQRLTELNSKKVLGKRPTTSKQQNAGGFWCQTSRILLLKMSSFQQKVIETRNYNPCVRRRQFSMEIALEIQKVELTDKGFNQLQIYTRTKKNPCSKNLMKIWEWCLSLNEEY